MVILAISSIGALLGSVAKPTEHWFWEKTGITQGEALLIVLAALGFIWTIAILMASLHRARAAAMAVSAAAATAMADATAQMADVTAAAKAAERIARSRMPANVSALVAQKVGEGFEWSDRRRALMRSLLRRDGELIARDIEDAERASIVKVLRAVGYANYTLTPEGRNWLLSQNLDSTK